MVERRSSLYPPHALAEETMAMDPKNQANLRNGSPSARVRFYNFTDRKRKAFAITDTELNVIAALAIMGLSRIPKNG